MEHLRFCGSLNIACGYAGEQGFCTLTRCPVVLDEFQAMRRHQGPTGPKGRPDGYGNAGGNMMKSTCRGCGAPIVWIRTAAGPRGFCLPANIDGVRTVFTQQKVKAKPGQAERTAWRNVRDWVMAQMAIIEAGQVQMEEVFLPYLTDSSGQTLYQLYQRGRLSLGPGEG